MVIGIGRWLLMLLLLVETTTLAQSGFYTKTIDFSNKLNSRWEHPPFDNLGTMLLDAHLRGELSAYRYAVAHDVLKYAPIPQDQLPTPWDPTVEYVQEEMVSHKGNIYIARTDIASGSTPPDDSPNWEDTNIRGPAVSIFHHFPTAADTTTKSFLLSHMIEEEPRSYDPWSEGIEYFNDDRVEFEGRIYQAHRDNFLGITPGSDENYWTKIESKLTMYEPNDLNVVEILYHYEVKGSDTIHTPQMVSVKVIDQYREVFRNTGLNFYYNDVIRYLESSHQPTLHMSYFGLLDGGAFLFDEHTKFNFTWWIQSKILSKELKPDKKTILNELEYNQFINTKEEDLNVTNWYPIQNPATHDFTIIAGKLNADYEYFTIATLSVPYKSVEKLLKDMPPVHVPKTYKDIFSNSFLYSTIDTVQMDSIEVLQTITHPSGGFNQMYFDELHFDKTDASPIVAAAIPGLWKLIEAAVQAGKVELHPTRSYYPCHFNWKGTEIRWSTGSQKADDNFSISHVTPAPNELPNPQWRLKETGVVYRINQTPPYKNGKYWPVQLVVSFEPEPHADLVDYRVDWKDVLKLVQGKNEYADFVAGAEKATLNFKRVSVSYNYLMVR